MRGENPELARTTEETMGSRSFEAKLNCERVRLDAGRRVQLTAIERKIRFTWRGKSISF
jgi:hypothetical protein